MNFNEPIISIHGIHIYEKILTFARDESIIYYDEGRNSIMDLIFDTSTWIANERGRANEIKMKRGVGPEAVIRNTFYTSSPRVHALKGARGKINDL